MHIRTMYVFFEFMFIANQGHSNILLKLTKLLHVSHYQAVTQPPFFHDICFRR